MTGPFADRLFRIAFALAGCYNLAFGIWAGFWPLAFFELFDLPAPQYPGIWACLGMVVGVYGLLYWHAAWKLETAWPIIAVGLLGKVLGPIGMAMSFGHDWPRRLGMICIYNDLIWWLPFALFVVRGTALGERLVRWAPWICVVSHAAATIVMVAFLRRGMLTESNEWFRAAYIAEHAALWTIGWSLWMFAAMTVVGFYAWWGSHLAAGQAFQPDTSHSDGAMLRQARKPDLRAFAPTLAVLIAAFGTIFDFSGEGLSILLLVERAAPSVNADSVVAWNSLAFTSVERGFTLLSAGAANLLYTLGGILLMLVTPNLPTWVRAAMWITWLAGIAMTVAGLMNHVGGMVVSTAVLFPLLIIWTAWMGALETAVKRVVVLGGLGQFGRTAAEQLRSLGCPAKTASRSGAADLQVDANDAVSIRVAFRAGDIILDAAGPFHARSTALVEAATEIGFDIVDINDDLRYAQAILALEPRIEKAGIRVLSSASTVSAVAAAVVRHSGMATPIRVTAFLAPASRHTANTGAALSLIRCVGRPVELLRGGQLQERHGWSEARRFRMPPPVGTICGRLFESADTAYLPHIWPTLRDVAMYVDTNTPGVNTLLRLAARWPAVRSVLERQVRWSTRIARTFGSPAGGIGYEIEDVSGRVARYAIVSSKNSFVTAVAPAVLAARAIAEDYFTPRGQVLPDRHVEPDELFAFLNQRGIALDCSWPL